MLYSWKVLDWDQVPASRVRDKTIKPALFHLNAVAHLSSYRTIMVAIKLHSAELNQSTEPLPRTDRPTGTGKLANYDTRASNGPADASPP